MANKEPIAINVAEINKLMLEIIDCSNNIKVIFNRINDLVLETKSYYDSSSANLLRSKYSLFNDNYSTIIKNIMSYSKDLSSLKKKYALNMDNLSNQIRVDKSKLDGPQTYKEGR